MKSEEIDQNKKKVEKLASFGLTNIEIADALEYNEDTLKRNFEIFLIKGRANLKQRLKRKQIQVAMSGNVVMLIWLGKQYLDQSDKVVETGDYQIEIKRKKIGKESSHQSTVGSRQKEK